MPALPLSDIQLAESAKLKSLFVEWQRHRREAGEPHSQEVAASLLGFNQSALNQYLNGKIPLNVDAAIKLAGLMGCSVAEFSPTLVAQAAKYLDATAIREPSMSMDEALRPFDVRPVRVTESPSYEVTPIKRVNLSLQAGIMGFEATQISDDDGTLDLPTSWINENDLVSHCLIAINIKGDSMIPVFYEKDIVVINIADTKKVNGKIYAINFNGEAVIKRLIYEGREWYMMSENPEHKRRMCRGGDCIIIGRIVRFEARNFKDRL